MNKKKDYRLESQYRKLFRQFGLISGFYSELGKEKILKIFELAWSRRHSLDEDIKDAIE